MERPFYLEAIARAFRSHPVVGILGPRQCGKTTLARMYAQNLRQVTIFDLEDDLDLAQLEQPKWALKGLQGLVMIDEIQRAPQLFRILRVLVDRPKNRTKFLILGSASRDLIQQGSESLAGRISYIHLSPFTATEASDLQRLWIRGGFPRSYLAKSLSLSVDWRKSYIKTFLEQDIPSLGIQIPAQSLRRFWLMLAHYHGQIFNASEIGGSLGVADTTVRSYLDILSGTFMVRQLQPWIENIKKRQVKSPKIYFTDSGIFHSLLGITDERQLRVHPKLGASWEGFALEEVIRAWHAQAEEVFFWGIHAQAELDLMILHKGKRFGFEFKFADAPRMTHSLSLAQKTLCLSELMVIYPGDKVFSLEKNIQAAGLQAYLQRKRK